MRFACDTGGTFTDLVIEDEGGRVHMFKAPTTPADPVEGILDAVDAAAAGFGVSANELLAQAESFVHGTTHAINAIITGNTAKTAFLTTQGHPDILVVREGGRLEPFNFAVPFPKPYIPRALTFEISGRIASDGKVVENLEDDQVIRTIAKLKRQKVEAVAVCLLWSTVNAAHENRVGRLLKKHLPGVPFTLSHILNPVLREYRRASSAAIDASLKPMMSNYLGSLAARLQGAGFGGRLLMLTSKGGVMDFADLAEAPIHAIGSGPSMAPLAGRYFAQTDTKADTAIVADTGGTAYDVSLVRRGTIPMTPETWIGQRYRGLPLRVAKFRTAADVARLREDFDKAHEEVFAYSDPDSEVQFVGWRAVARCRLAGDGLGHLAQDAIYGKAALKSRKAHFDGTGIVAAKVHEFADMKSRPITGPAIIESPFTTVVIDPGAVARRAKSGSLVITP